MERERAEYRGHMVELRAGEPDSEPDLLIDNKPVRYGVLPDGLYYLHEYAYDWSDSLMDLARRFIDSRRRTNEAEIDG